MLATESFVVCTRSPEKIADDLAMLVPFSIAFPWLYNMAAGWSATNQAPGKIMSISQLRIFTYRVLIIALPPFGNDLA
jgi:hypothetical protein